MFAHSLRATSRQTTASISRRCVLPSLASSSSYIIAATGTVGAGPTHLSHSSKGSNNSNSSSSSSSSIHTTTRGGVSERYRSSLSSSVSQSLSQPRWATVAATTAATTMTRSFATKTSTSVTFDLPEAIRLARVFAPQRCAETVELSVRMNVDPRKPNQMIRGVASLPHGSGQKVVVAVFAQGAKAQEALDAGADIVGAQDLVDDITAGNIKFTKCIATPDMMGTVGRVARMLGPKGLMPNPKLGSVTMDVASAVTAAKQGQATFKTAADSCIRAAVGKLTLDDEALLENINAFIAAIHSAKPTGAPKGSGYFVNCWLSTTQGAGIPVDVRRVPFKKG